MHINEVKSELLDWLEENQPRFIHMANEIWKRPEILWEEFFASKLQADFLEDEGFTVTRDVAGMNTAFVAEWGEGKPVIGFIGEYDALPGLSQKAQSSQEPVQDGAHGHGCGHNMLGTAPLAAALATQKLLARTGRKGTVRYYGCPAEEGGGGKVFMAREGLYDDLDTALTWHPGSLNTPGKGGTVAIINMVFRFKGRAAHAGVAPHLGRSALDAVELMNVGANYLREHVLDGTRIQYVITDGGMAANIVPETAEVQYILRAAKTDYLTELAGRVEKIAEGAAMMTETSVEVTRGIAYANLKPNHYLADLLYEAMEAIGPIEFMEDEIAFAQQINDSYPGTNEEYVMRYLDFFKPDEAVKKRLLRNNHLPLIGENIPAFDGGTIMGGATDVGDLSQVTPTGVFFATCFTTGSPGHSWANTAAGGMSIGHKGMMHAAKTLTLTAWELVENPEHLEEVRAEFDQMMGGKKYEPLIPADLKPPRNPMPIS